MKKAKQCLIALLSGVLLAITVLSGCGQSQKAVSKNDDHLTVYLWENRLMKNIVPYIHEQFPDQDIFCMYSARLISSEMLLEEKSIAMYPFPEEFSYIYWIRSFIASYCSSSFAFASSRSA